MAPIQAAVPPPNDNYAGQKHEQMKSLVTDNYVPETATDVADVWKKFGDTFKELANDFSILVNGSQSAWTGQAADGVRTALSKVGTFADQTGDSFHKTSGAIEGIREAAVHANNSMPEPVDANPFKIAGKWLLAGGPINPVAMVGGPVEMYVKHQEQQDAKAQAVQVMQTRDNTMMSAAMSMPTMEAPPQVTQDQGVTQTSSSSSSSSLNSNNGYRPPGTTGMPSSSTGNGTTNASWVAPQVKDPNLPNNLNQGGGNQNRPPIGPPPGFLPPGMRPPGGGQPGRPPMGGPGMRPGGPGGGPGGAGAGRGMGPGGMGGPGAGRGMGSFGPANPGGGAGVMGGANGPGGAGAGAGAGRGGAAGAAGAGGAGGAQGGQGGEDKEHKSNYLVPTDEFFDDDRMVAPPVIGG